MDGTGKQIISETQQQALQALHEQNLSVDYIGEVFTVIMEGDTEIIYKALQGKWSAILKETGSRFGRT